MSKKKYITQKTIHFGSLRKTLPKGALIIYDNIKQTIQICGQIISNLLDFNICLTKGYVKLADQKSEQKKVEIKKQEKKQSMPIYKSCEDEHLQIKKIQEQVKKEEQSGQMIRGMRVIKNQSEQIVESDGIKIKVESVKETTNDDIKQEINKQAKVIGKVSEISNKKQTNNKKNAEANAKKRAARRKKQSEQNQKKMKANNK